MRDALVVMLVLGLNATSATGSECLDEVTIPPNTTRTVAVRGNDESGVYKSRTIELFATVRTDDGRNRLHSAWIKLTDIFRWGVNFDVKGPLGPVVDFNERFSVWGKGGAEFRVRTTNSRTRLCICSAHSLDDLPNNYVESRDQCKRAAREQRT